MSLTAAYSRLHSALVDTAREEGLVPHDVRVLVALEERGGVATTYELYDDLLSEGTAVRRSLLTLYPREYVTGVGVDGKKRRPGIVTRLALTPAGSHVLVRFRELLGGSHEYPVGGMTSVREAGANPDQEADR